MLMEELKSGQEVWFKSMQRDEHGRMRYAACSGRVNMVTENKVCLEGTGETEGTYEVRPYMCFRTRDRLEADMKWDRLMDDFSDKLCSTGEKYVTSCTNLLKNCVKGYVKSQVPQGQELAVSEASRRMRQFGDRFREKVGSLADNFVKDAQQQTHGLMKKEIYDLAFRTDLSRHEPDSSASDGITLTDADLDFGNDMGMML